MMTHEEIMQLGVDRARKTMNQNIGGPFGAVITKGDEIISVASNTVLLDHDPTAHAEINAIRKACQVLGTHDLTGCTIYCTSEPCPMCLSAIIWSNIKVAYFGCDSVDADHIGFRDVFIYNFIYDSIEYGCKDPTVLKMIPSSRDSCIKLFNEYQDKKKQLY